MLSTKHRHKLIEGLVGAMGRSDEERPKPKLVIAIGGPPKDDPMPADDKGDEGDDTGKLEEGSPEEEKAEPVDEKRTEEMKCARDAARALGIGDLDDDQAKSFAEAIKTIVGGY